MKQHVTLNTCKQMEDKNIINAVQIIDRFLVTIDKASTQGVCSKSSSSPLSQQISSDESSDDSSTSICHFEEQKTKQNVTNCFNKGLFLQKMQCHLKNTVKSDKYVRMCVAILKNVRAYQPNNLGPVYSELLIFRRIIRWQGKYQTLKALITQTNCKSQQMFKYFQLFGDLVDLFAFWLRLCKPKQAQLLIQKLQQMQSNCYFTECMIWLCIYVLGVYRGKGQPQEQYKNKLKFAKYVCDCITSYNNSSFAIYKLNPKVGSLLSLVSSFIGLHILWI